MAKVQMALLSRGLLTGSEVLALLACGLGKGAMARARTIHELAVVSDFIAKRGLRAARRYVDYYDLDRLKAERSKLRELKRRRRRSLRSSGRNPAVRYLEQQVHELERRRKAHVRRHGSRFAGEYGWAAPWWRGKKTRVSFAMIERRVRLDRARPYYKYASLIVHAGPLGVLDNYDSHGQYMVDASEHHLDTAAENAPIWLTHLCMTATAAIDGDHSALLPRLLAMSSLALDVREAFSTER